MTGFVQGSGRIKPGEETTVTVEILGGQLKPGPLQADIKVVTSNQFHYMILIPVRGTVLAPKKKPVEKKE